MRSIVFGALALAACSHTWDAKNDYNEHLTEHSVHSGLADGYNETYTKDHEPSVYERCMVRNRGAENAEELCLDYVKAGMPSVDERCQGCVDSPYYHYGFYGY